MVITWRISRRVHTVSLYDDSDDCQGILMSQYLCDVVIFHELVDTSIPVRHIGCIWIHPLFFTEAPGLETQNRKNNRRQGTVADVLT